MLEIIGSTLTSILIVALVVKIMKLKEPYTKSGSYIEFTFTKLYKIVMLLCSIVGAVVALGFLVLGIIMQMEEDDIVPFLLIILLFFLLTVLCTGMYLFVRNKKLFTRETPYALLIFWAGSRPSIFTKLLRLWSAEGME